jgi:hypothetical protein
MIREGVQHILSRHEYELDVPANCVMILLEETLELENIMLVTNLVTNEIIYNPLCDGLGGTLDDNVLIFEKDLSADSSNGDSLMIAIRHNVNYVGIEGSSKPVQEENSFLLKEILQELKINNIHLSLINGQEIRLNGK